MCVFCIKGFCLTEIPNDADFWSDIPDSELCDFIIEKMTDTELLSQMFMFGWAGLEPSVLLTSWVAQRGLGSVKVFGWNTDDTLLVAQSITKLQALSQERRFKIPLFVATDQEGGFIRHVKGQTSTTPGNLSIGATSYPYDAYYTGYYINREIAALGINMNFAPTVDLFTNKNSTIIGTRSFCEDPQQAGILGVAFAEGSKAACVIPTAKHFPGHGDTDIDSHGQLPVINIDSETFFNRELVPFSNLVQSKIPAIMSAHLSFPQIDETGAPASLSRKILQDILRDKMNYTGLIITDDMMMNGATLFAGSMSLAYQMAILAGNDIIISSTCANLDATLWTHNLNLLKNDSEFRQKVKTAVRRILLTKMQYFKHSPHVDLYPKIADIDKCVPDKDGQKFFLQQACRSITLYKKTSYPLPAQSGENILLAGSFPAFFDEGKRRYPKSKYFKFSYELGPNETQWVKDNIVSTLNGIDTIILCVSNDRSMQIAQFLRSFGKKIIIFSIMSPVGVLDYGWADTVLLGYSYSSYTFQALFSALVGEFTPEGTLPFTK